MRATKSKSSCSRRRRKPLRVKPDAADYLRSACRRVNGTRRRSRTVAQIAGFSAKIRTALRADVAKPLGARYWYFGAETDLYETPLHKPLSAHEGRDWMIPRCWRTIAPDANCAECRRKHSADAGSASAGQPNVVFIIHRGKRRRTIGNVVSASREAAPFTGKRNGCCSVGQSCCPVARKLPAIFPTGAFQAAVGGRYRRHQRLHRGA